MDRPLSVTVLRCRTSDRTPGGARGAEALGLALDPNFEENGYVYVAYTYRTDGGMQNRLVRMREDDTTGRGLCDAILLDDLRGAIYVLACAVEDVDRDVAERPSPVEVRSALDWLLAAARPLAERR